MSCRFFLFQIIYKGVLLFSESILSMLTNLTLKTNTLTAIASSSGVG